MTRLNSTLELSALLSRVGRLSTHELLTFGRLASAFDRAVHDAARQEIAAAVMGTFLADTQATVASLRPPVQGDFDEANIADQGLSEQTISAKQAAIDRYRRMCDAFDYSSANAVAIAAGLSPTTVRAYELGLGAPRRSTLQALAKKAFHGKISPDELSWRGVKR